MDDELRALRDLGAGLRPEDLELETPPSGLWDRIAAETDLDGAGGADDDVIAPPTPIRPRGARTGWWIVGAAAAVLAVVGGVVVATRSSEPTPNVVASVTLDRLGDTGSGGAELIDDDGTYRLLVDTEGLDPGDGFLEVWVIDREVSRLISLGPLRSDGTYDLPPGIDPADFPVVDVSVEPLDGDPAHSGDSVLRGTLEV